MPSEREKSPTWKASFKDGMSRLWRTEGRKVWERMERGLISKYEKSLVAADQDLCEATLEKMVEARGGPEGLKKIDWHWGGPDSDPKDDSSDIGWATLSYCIKQDRNATWAEIVARYALLRRLPFLEVALGLRELQAKDGLCYFDDTTQEPIKWSPSSAYNRRVNLADDWAAIAQDNA